MFSHETEEKKSAGTSAHHSFSFFKNKPILIKAQKEELENPTEKFHQDILTDKLLRFTADKTLGPCRKITFDVTKIKDPHHVAKAMRYRLKEQTPQKIDQGYCFGLVILLICHILSGKKQEEFFDSLKLLMKYSDTDIFEKEKEFMSIFGKLEFAQWCHYYTDHIDQSRINTIIKIIAHIDIEKESKTHHYTEDEFNGMLSNLSENHFMIIGSFSPKEDRSGHTVCAYRCGKEYYLYDANFDEGLPKKYSIENSKMIFHELKNSFYRKFGYEVPGEFSKPFKMKLEVDIVKPKSKPIVSLKHRT